MKRILRILIIFIVLVCFSSFLYAYEKSDTINTFSKIIESYNEGNENIYSYIDTTNKQMYKDFKYNMGKGNVTYNENIGILDISKDEYKLAVLMDGSGKIFNSSWSVKNKYIYFTFKYNESKKSFILTDTDFFDASGINVLKEAYIDILIIALSRAIPMFIIVLSVVSIISKFIDIKRAKNIIN